MPMGAVEIVCDANQLIGLGHLRRSQTLAAELISRGTPAHVRCLSQQGQALLQSQPVADEMPALIVLDLPEGSRTLMAQARQSGRTVVGLDWFGEEDVDVNIVVFEHEPARARVALHTGWPFVMIRPEIAARAGGGELSSDGRRVLVFLGGGDLLGQGHASAALLARAGFEVLLVQGPMARDQQDGAGYEVRVNPTDLSELLAGCDWTVSNGGTCMFESLCVGKPPYVLPQTAAEERVSASMANHGALLGRGFDGLRLLTPLSGVCSREQLRGAVHRARGLIDGRGVIRVAEIVEGLMQ